MVNLPDLSPKTTIFYWSLHLSQTTHVRSPRDPTDTVPIVKTRSFSLFSKGSIPEGCKNPPLSTAALWRGEEAGGKDKGAYSDEDYGFMPKDDQGRPSTVAG